MHCRRCTRLAGSTAPSRRLPTIPPRDPSACGSQGARVGGRAEWHGRAERVKTRWGKRTAADFAQICNDGAREAALGDGSFVARNGTVIEQSQILTTHNLAPLVGLLALSTSASASAADWGSAALDWIVKEQNTRYDSWRSQLLMLKNTAYALRQALFFLSFVEPATQRHVVSELKSRAASEPDDWQARFAASTRP